jgi:UDP-GlcNAc:undecaprenyl-phosphate GlcNAc-1-phosphate transferase
MLNYLLLTLIAFCASLLLTPVVRDLAWRIGAVDKPGARKIHLAPVPRLGGISVVFAVGLTILTAYGLDRLNLGFTIVIDLWSPLFLGAIIVFLVGVWDDVRPLPAWLKFLFQAVAAGIAIWGGIRIEYLSPIGDDVFSLGMLAIPITFLWIVGLTNAFNLIDGLDGLAAGLGLIAAVTTATIFFMTGQVSHSLLLLILAGALAGFLRYNFHPASIFLGDSGSQFIGYVLAVTAITEVQKASTTLPVIIPLLVFGLPIFDTLISMIRRAFKGMGSGELHHTTLRKRIVSARRIFHPDRDHVHHRLLTMGFSHRCAVLMLYGLAVALSLLAFISEGARHRNSWAILLTVIVVMYIGLRKLGYDELAVLRTATALRWRERIIFTRLTFYTIVDWVLIAAAYWAAFLLKYDGAWAPGVTKWYLLAFPVVCIIQMSVFFGLGLYQGIWRVMGIADLLALSFAAGIAVLLSHVLLALLHPPTGIWAFFVIDGLLLQFLLLGGRSAYKILTHLGRRDSTTEGAHVLVYGAGRRGESILQELTENRTLGLHLMGFLDDDPHLIGTTINRVRIIGSSLDLDSILNSQKVSAVIIASHKITAERLFLVLNLCSKYRIPVLRGEFQLEPLAGVRLSGTREGSAKRKQIKAAAGVLHAPEDASTVNGTLG